MCKLGKVYFEDSIAVIYEGILGITLQIDEMRAVCIINLLKDTGEEQ
jgi:hypothetical protein